MPELKEEKSTLEIPKPPVVVVLGHIDHGKSTLIEKIKNIKITEKETGGITQHIGAYEITLGSQGETKEVKKITFLDTPGHEAFSAIRSRGAKVADIAILVVDTTEGVRAQTKEAIEVVKKAQIPLIVALNKIDQPQAQPEKTKEELAKAGVRVESLGGKIPAVKTSGKTGQGIEELLETILLVGELEQLKTTLKAPAQGTVIESALDHLKGPVATLLLEKGILKENDVLGTPSTVGRVRKITDFQGQFLKQVFPSQPCQILGFFEVPKVGEKFKVFPDLSSAKKELKKEKFEPISPLIEGDKKVLNIILKADVLGSLEAIEKALLSIPQQEVILRIIKREIGNIGIFDLQLAQSAKAKIFGFRVEIERSAKNYFQQKKVFPKIFEVIYDLVEEVRKEMARILAPELKRVNFGKIKVLVLFKKGKKGQIIGGRVIDGEITKDTLAEVLREEEIIGQGKIKNIQQEKKDIAKASKGKEIGILFEGEPEIKEGDILQVFKQEKVKKTF